MEFIISRNTLFWALQHTRHAMKGAHDIFCDFVLTFSDDQAMTVHASNGNIWICETVALDSPAIDARPIAIWSSYLLRSIKKLEQQPLRFVVGEMQMTVEHSCGSFKVPLSSQANEFLSRKCPCPDAEASDSCLVEYEAPMLKSILNRCHIAMAQDELRPIMNGVLFRHEEDYSDYVSSDGHKLVRVRKNPVICVGAKHQPVSYIIPYNVVQILRRILPSTGDVTVEYQEEIKEIERKAAARITIDDNITISFNPVEGRYPSYQSVIPEYSVFEVTVNRKDLLRSLDRLSVFSPCSNLVILSIGDNELNMKTRDRDFETEGEEKIACSVVKTDGTEFIPGSLQDLGIKGTTLNDVLKAVSSENVVFKITDNTRAVIIHPAPQPDVEEVTLLMMPMIFNMNDL